MTLHTLGQIVHLLSYFLLIVDARCTLQKTRMKIEDIARVSLTTRRTTKNKRHLTICNCLFGQVVINNER